MDAIKKQPILYILALFLWLALFFSIFLTRIDIYYFTILLPVSLLAITVFPSEKESAELWQAFKSFLLSRYTLAFLLISLLPILHGAFGGDYPWSEHPYTYWINARTSYVAIGALMTGQLLRVLMDRLEFTQATTKTIMGFALLGSFLVDFLYSLFKLYFEGSARWEGSAGNPNIWAVQAALILIFIVAMKAEVKKSAGEINWFQSIWDIGVPLLLLAAILAFSLANYIALAITIIAFVFYLTRSREKWIWSSIFAVAVIAVVLISYLIFNVDFDYLMQNQYIKQLTDLSLAKKIIPRLKLWSHISDFWQADWVWFGSGYQTYSAWLAGLKDGHNFSHIHNVYLHFFIQYGLLGLIPLLYLIWTWVTNPKISFSFLAFYFLIVSCFDCAILCYENIIVIAFIVAQLMEPVNLVRFKNYRI